MWFEKGELLFYDGHWTIKYLEYIELLPWMLLIFQFQNILYDCWQFVFNCGHLCGSCQIQIEIIKLKYCLSQIVQKPVLYAAHHSNKADFTLENSIAATTTTTPKMLDFKINRTAAKLAHSYWASN